MAGYTRQARSPSPRKILARNPEREVGAFLSVLLAVANNRCLAMSARPCTMPCGSWRRSGRTSPIPIQAMRVALLACGSHAPGVAAAPGGRSTGASAVTSSSPVGPDGGKDPRGFRQASEHSGGSPSWKRNDHNGAAVRVAD
jgi:hypothetical protein